MPYAAAMVLRVRHGSVETWVEGKAALARLYRTRRIGSDDLVWHPVQRCWVAVAAFLVLDPGEARALRWSAAMGGARRPPDAEDEREVR